MTDKLLRFLLIAALAILPLQVHAADKLTVLLDWFVNPDHAPLYVALDRGYFADENLTVELIAPADPNDPPKLVAARKAEIAISYQPQLHLQADQGLPLVRFGTLVATPLSTVLTLADGPIKTVADLKGKTVGFSVSGTEEAVLAAVLKSAGLTLADIKLVNVNFSLSPSLASGQVDAVVGAYRNFELTQMDLIGKKGRPFFIEEHGVPPYDQLIYVAHKDSVGDPRLRRFLSAVEKGTQYLINHPQETWDAFAKNQPELNDELNRRAWFDTLSRFAHRPAAMDNARYDRFARFLLDAKLIKEIKPVSSYAVELPY
ncbi:ABC transporter substrate-binding protein [Oceanibaculum pacificum]|uniref:ABC transporter ATP-binding protein n=1 Tax=Oceanibaculum pacificum TaxID=580166 RepID=A0A154VX48_9PROT|nr:ABC transporter substrate-binding protein [Oceanibaculum pacificum]KZD05860.1 ABC transporter ATP-binding protein [Oceanibaculum pacificum]